MINHPFFVGQKVVCINDTYDPQFPEYGDFTPKKGLKYTVREISKAPHWKTRELYYGVLLEEIINPKLPSATEVIFSTYRFVPAEEYAVEEKAMSSDSISID